MSSGGKDNKRKFYWKGGNKAKKFQGNKHDASHEYTSKNHNVRTWDQGNRHRGGFSNSYEPPNYSWGSKGTSGYNRYRYNNSNNYYQQTFEFTPPLLTEPPKEPEESVVSGPGSVTERLEKVLAAKKRIEEALASKTSDGNGQEIPLEDSARETNKDRPTDILQLASVDLRLTNSDFKEIGSVVSNVGPEVETEGGDIVLNTSPCISQQRSFNNTCPNPAPTSSKSPRVGGWSMSTVNEIVSSDQQDGSNLPRTGGEIYFQERRERILGNIQPNTVEQSISPPKPSTSHTSYEHRNKFSRVGRLYQSFLKSRLCGYTLKMRDKTAKSSGPNPFLDKSVLENQNPENFAGESATSIENDKILELQMPRPIQVKMENHEGSNRVSTPEDIAAEEANEFCKEFSFLLTHPNFLIPPEDLMKFGLGHLSEMTRLLNERRNGEEIVSPLESQDSPLRVRSLDALNSVTEHDIAFNQPPVNSSHHDSVPVQTTSPINSSINDSIVQEPVANVVTMNLQQPSIGVQPQNFDFQTLRDNPPIGVLDSQVLRNGHMKSQSRVSPVPDVPDPDKQNHSVESVVEKVVERLLKSSNESFQISSANIQSLIKDRILRSSSSESQNEPTPSTSQQPSNHLQDISSKILAMFLIDKQIEELALEKMKIYNELLSAKEISSTLFNSWAQDQIQQGNVLNIIANSSKRTSESSTEPRKSVQGTSSSVFLSKSFNQNPLQQAISELLSLKREMVSDQTTTVNDVKTEPSQSTLEPCEPVFLTPTTNNLENNRPKLSVRKDLHDPNLSMELCETNSFNCPAPPEEVSTGTVSGCKRKDKVNVNQKGAQSGSLKSTKVKKKSKKNKVDCVIDLVGDSTDEEMCVSIECSTPETDPLASEEISSRGSSEVNGPTTKKSTRTKLKLDSVSVTCLLVVKKALVVGSKEGYITVFSILNKDIHIMEKIHTEPILFLHYAYSYVLTGSADSTISLFPLKKQLNIQTVQVIGPVQSCDDTRPSQIYVGTKNGYLVHYRLKKDDTTTEVSLELVQQPILLTNSSIVALKAVRDWSGWLVIVASRGEQITVRSTTSGEVLRTFNWCDTIHCLQMYKTLVYCGTNTRSVQVIDYLSEENKTDCQLGRSVVQIMFKESVMFAACKDGKVYVYDVEDKQMITVMAVTKGPILGIAIYKNKIIVAADHKKELQIVPFPQELKNHMKKNVIVPNKKLKCS